MTPSTITHELRFAIVDTMTQIETNQTQSMLSYNYITILWGFNFKFDALI